MARDFIILILSLIFFSCEKEVLLTDIITEVVVSPSELTANGSDIANIKVVFNEDADLNKAIINCNINNGVIVESDKKSHTINAVQNLNDSIFAEFNILSSTNPTDIVINIKVDKYKEVLTIPVKLSQPHSIKLKADAFSVKRAYEGEINLEAYIANINNKKVSDGVKVAFFDYHLNNTPVDGSFRETHLTSIDSKVSAIYSPGLVDSGQYIILKADILNENDQSIGINDSILIYVK